MLGGLGGPQEGSLGSRRSALGRGYAAGLRVLPEAPRRSSRVQPDPPNWVFRFVSILPYTPPPHSSGLIDGKFRTSCRVNLFPRRSEMCRETKAALARITVSMALGNRLRAPQIAGTVRALTVQGGETTGSSPAGDDPQIPALGPVGRTSSCVLRRISLLSGVSPFPLTPVSGRGIVGQFAEAKSPATRRTVGGG